MKNSLKVTLLIGIVVLVLMGTVACGRQAPSPTPVPSPKPSPTVVPSPKPVPTTAPSPKPTPKPSPAALPRIINLPAAAVGSGTYADMSGVASVLSRRMGAEVKAMATAGPIENAPMLAAGTGDLVAVTAYDARLIWLAKGGFEKPLQGKGGFLRLILTGTPQIRGMLTAADTGIKTGQDVKGKRYIGIATGTESATAAATANLAFHNLKPEDVRMITVPSVAAGGQALLEKRGDVLGFTTFGAGVIKELDVTRGAVFIPYEPMTPEAIKRYKDVYPVGDFLKVSPGPDAVGIREPITLARVPFYFNARKGLSDDAVYQIVKTLWDYNSELRAISAELNKWTTQQFFLKEPDIPYHNGAIRFYKEKGLWTPETEKRQQELLAQEK